MVLSLEMRVSIFHYFLKLFINIFWYQAQSLLLINYFKDKMSHKAFFPSHFVSNVSKAGVIESCPSSPLFIPAKPVKKSVRRTRKHTKEGSRGSTDSEDLPVAGIKETSKKKRRKGQTNQKESKGKTAGNDRGEERQDGKSSTRSTVMEKFEDKALSARQEQDRTTSPVTILHTAQPPSNMISKFPGMQILIFIWFDSCKTRWKNSGK